MVSVGTATETVLVRKKDNSPLSLSSGEMVEHLRISMDEPLRWANQA